MSSSRKRRGSDSAHSDNSRLQKVLVLGDNNETFKDHIKRLESQLASQEVSYNQQIESFNETNKHLLRRITTLDDTNQELIQRIETLDESIGHYRQLADENRNKDRTKHLELEWASLEKTAPGPIREQGPRRDNTPEYHKSLRDRDKNQWKQKEVAFQREIDKLKAQLELGNPKVSSSAKGKSVEATADAKDLSSRLRRSEEARKALEQRIIQMQEGAVNTVTHQTQASGDKPSELETLNQELSAEVVTQREQLADMQRDKEIASRERDEALEREHEVARLLGISDEALQESQASLTDAEATHKALLTDYGVLGKHIKVLRTEKESVIQERDKSLAREQETAGKLRISDQTLQKHLRDLEESNASLANAQTVHKALLTEYATLDEQITMLRTEKELVIQERDEALAREHETAGNLQINDEALQKHMRKQAELQASLVDTEATHEALLSKHTALKRQMREDLVNPDGRIASLWNEKESVIQERDEALAREQETSAKLRISDETLQKHLRDLEESKASLADVKTVHKALLTEYAALDEQIAMLRTEKELVIQERDDALTREHETAGNLKISDEALQKHMRNLEELQTSLTDAETAHEALHTEHATMDEQITVLQTEKESVIQERDEALAREQETAGKLRISDDALHEHIRNLEKSQGSLTDVEIAHKALLAVSLVLENIKRRISLTLFRAQEYADLDKRITILRTEKESVVQERDEALAREQETAGKLRISDEALHEHIRNLEKSQGSLTDAEIAHKALLTEYADLDKHIKILRTEKESVVQERDEALAREQETAGKLRISDEALHEHIRNLEQSQASLTSTKAAHNALLSEHSALQGRSKEGHASQDRRITALQTKHGALERELAEVVASSKEAQRLAFDERDVALSQELKMSQKLHACQEALQHQIENVQALQRVPHTRNEEHVEALNESHSRIRNLRRALERPQEKEKFILELQGLRQRDQTELRQAREDSHIAQSRHNELVRRHDKEQSVLRTRLNQGHTPRLDYRPPNRNITSMNQGRPRTTINRVLPRQEQNVPAQDHGGNSLVDYFKKETLRGANIIKETKHAQRALYKYELVSPILLGAAYYESKANLHESQQEETVAEEDWQVALQPREPSVSPSSSSSDSSSSDEGESDTEEVKAEHDDT
ncbi:hypothetical protein V5O48_006486 [Marasmius crinis-equi]|uniref:Uncharacterized protein n=1 Tax=Marasmius crinis-equi TaxID=585013 RepID=A0ABR3FJD5_9AGAR